MKIIKKFVISFACFGLIILFIIFIYKEKSITPNPNLTIVLENFSHQNKEYLIAFIEILLNKEEFYNRFNIVYKDKVISKLYNEHILNNAENRKKTLEKIKRIVFFSSNIAEILPEAVKISPDNTDILYLDQNAFFLFPDVF